MDNKLQSFSSDGTLIAICDKNAITKIWDTHSGFLEHEFQPAEYLSSAATCLKFSPNVSNKQSIQSSNTDTKEQLLALGTIEGAVLIYNYTKKEVAAKLIHSTSSPVTDLCWHSFSKLITIGKDNNLIHWDVFTKTKLREFSIKGNSSLCWLGKNRLSVASNHLHLMKFNPKSKVKKEIQLTGHNTSILQLAPIFLDTEKEARYILSVAESDRFIYAWSTNWEQMEPIASFMVKDIVRSVTCTDLSNSSIGILVSTRKGLLKYFSHHLNGSKHTKPIKSKGSLKISSKSNEEAIIPIIGAHFISSTTILFMYGTEIFPQYERILVEQLNCEVKLIRKDPSLFAKKKSSLIKTVTPIVSNESVHLLPTQYNSSEIKEISRKRKNGDDIANLPMEQRLDSLSLTQSLSSTTKGRPMDNYVHLLVQALHSKDSNLLGNILLKGEEEEEIIHSTVKRLPVASIVPFLQYLQEVIAGRGVKNLSFITWIKSVFYHHMSHLSSIPDKEPLMQPFYVICASRTSTLPTITKLHSRINLLLTHVKTRHENAAQKASGSQSDALLVYKEESSDDEDMHLGISGAHSESEDNWDFLTEDENDDAEVDEDDMDDEEVEIEQVESDAIEIEEDESGEDGAEEDDINGEMECEISDSDDD